MQRRWPEDHPGDGISTPESERGPLMTPRFSYTTTDPNAYDAMHGLESYLEKCAIEQPLIHLVKLRASQINGCAYCIDMHWKDLRALGESELRLYLLDAWRESPQFTPRERAALAWTEAVTLVADGHVPDEVFGEVRQEFDEPELADLTLVIATINAWNRLSISSRAVPGAYVSSLVPATA
jgi:AhpD family alkylhydroperoxidase